MLSIRIGGYKIDDKVLDHLTPLISGNQPGILKSLDLKFDSCRELNGEGVESLVEAVTEVGGNLETFEIDVRGC